MENNFTYYEIIKKTSAAFGTLFNNMYIRHKDGNGEDYSYQKVPLGYGPMQQFLARLEQKPDPRNRVAITLPRMSFEISNINYDPSRKSSSIQTFKALTTSGNRPVNVFMPVPYNLTYELSIATKLNDDMFQIIEQILPMFKPEHTLTVNLIDTIGEKRDIPIVFQGITPLRDNYEGDFTDRRFIECTLTFLVKLYLFGPIPNVDEGGKIIKKVQVDYYTDTNKVNSSRQLRYLATPRAIKDYNNDETTTISMPINETVTEFSVSDATSLIQNGYIRINDENMLIKSIFEDTITVLRGQDNTIASKHEEGDAINVINSQDDDLIIPGDSFDFDEERFDFGDGKIYSPSKGTDV